MYINYFSKNVDTSNLKMKTLRIFDWSCLLWEKGGKLL